MAAMEAATVTEVPEAETGKENAAPDKENAAPEAGKENAAPEKEKAAPEKEWKSTGYSGKYDWSSESATREKAASDVLGAAIVDYAFSDESKKVSVYVTLEGLEGLEEGAVTTELVDSRHAKMSVAFPSGTRVLDLKGLSGEVEAIKMIRKNHKSQVVLKLTKKKAGSWYKLIGGSMGAEGSYDDDDASDEYDDEYETNFANTKPDADPDDPDLEDIAHVDPTPLNYDDQEYDDDDITPTPLNPDDVGFVNKGDAGDEDKPDLEEDTTD